MCCWFLFSKTETSSDAEESCLNQKQLEELFTNQEWLKKKEDYPWLVETKGAFGCSFCMGVKAVKIGNYPISKKFKNDAWANCQILLPSKISAKKVKHPKKKEQTLKQVQRESLRKKINRHKKSESHMEANRVKDEAKKQLIEESVAKLVNSSDTCTGNLMRTAYYIAKNDRPFTDYESLLELLKIIGADVGISLHSRATATSMVNSIADQMKEIVVADIIKNNSKIVILVDESTSLSRKSCINVFLKTVVNGSEPFFVFLELTEVVDSTAKGILETIESVLKRAGFTKEWLQLNLIGFVSDGANVLLGKNNGVAAQLKRKYPDIFTFHCMNHRLELAVADTAKEGNGVSNFVSFIGAVNNVYSTSPKNVHELRIICSDLSIQMKKIGRIFDVRWVASSFRTVKALWQNFEALYKHFDDASADETRASKKRAKFKGLKNTLRSINFVKNLGLLYDVLQELSTLSLKMQERNTNIIQAERYIQTTIRYLISLLKNDDNFTKEARAGASIKSFKNVKLLNLKRVPLIKKNDFVQSLITNLGKRMSSNSTDISEILENAKVLDPNLWPRNEFGCVDVRHGQNEIQRLCEKFKVDSHASIQGMRDFIDNSNELPSKLKPLKNCILSLSCGTAECERGFSAMNLIVTKLRTLLTVENLNSLLFIKINGPPVHRFEPKKYVRNWSLKHKMGDDNRTRKVELKTVDKNDQKEQMYCIM